jgi:phytoene synthase
VSDALRHMAKGGKTFYFASMWLDRSVRNDAAVAYSFCRMVDDIADNLTPGEQRTTLLHGLLEAITTENRAHPKAQGMVELISRFPRIKSPVQDLIESCARDIPGIHVENELDLIHYSHGVAGTVGLIMYPILGGRAPEGERYAADLGIAMQCTNIARDVVADLSDNRVYLPREWLAGTDLRGLLKYDPLVEMTAVAAVRRLLVLSDEYYTRGLQGLPYLAPRCRFAIRVAAACYAAIGERVILGNKLARHRAVVPLRSKLMIMLRSSNTTRRRSHYSLSESVR